MQKQKIPHMAWHIALLNEMKNNPSEQFKNPIANRKKINTTGVTSGAGTTYPSGAPEFLVGFMLLDLQFYVCVLQIFVCPFILFFFWPLCCLFFFDIRIVITPLVSSNSSWLKYTRPLTFLPWYRHFNKRWRD